MAQPSKFVMTLFTVGTLALAACSGRCGESTRSGMIPPTQPQSATSVTAISVDRDMTTDEDTAEDGSILNSLTKEATIGSTVDPVNGDQNPYGLDIAKVSAGSFKAGDLAVCNFNDSANVQGNGTTVIALHPQPGSTPRHVAQDASLLGCTEVALAPSDAIWASAFVANDNPILTPSGMLITKLPGGPWHGPFGQVFAPHATPFGRAAFYESNASDGSIVRINIKSGRFTFDVIATGFVVNNGAPGSILGPSGLQYDAEHDRLYIVDGANNTVVTFRHVSTIPAGGITVQGTKFSGPFARRARLLFSGAPLNGPISSALFADGHLVVGNTLDPNGKNLMVELNSRGRVLAVKNVDTGAAGAIFGMVAANGDEKASRDSNRGEGDAKLYFNDDNDNTVRILTH